MYFLIPISGFFVALAIGAYIWAVRQGQYDDLDMEGQRILFEADPEKPSPTPDAPKAANPAQAAEPDRD